MRSIKIFVYIAGLYCMAFITSCSKEKIVDSVTSLSLINGVVGGTPNLTANFTGNTSIQGTVKGMGLAYGTYSTFNQTGSYSGMQPLAIYHNPNAGAHNKPILLLTLDLKPNTINTLFLAGTITAPDTLFTTDAPPYHETADSTLGIRFVHLSTGRAPISINIKGQANGSELSSLDYKRITPFRKYSAKKGISSYIFEFRDAASGALIRSYTLTGIDAAGTSAVPNRRRYRNLTIGLLGTPENIPSQTVGLFETFSPN